MGKTELFLIIKIFIKLIIIISALIGIVELWRMII